MIKLRQKRRVSVNGVEEVNSITFNPTFSTFPGGEEHVRIYGIVPGEPVDIEAKVRSSSDLMRLLLCMNAIEEAGSWWNTLYLPYLPYARQDRICNPGEANSLKLLLDLMTVTRCNSTGTLHQIVSMDVHNPTVLPHERNITLAELLESGKMGDYKERYQGYFVVSPDAGSCERSEEVAQLLGAPVVQATKVRDTYGKITGTAMEPTLRGSKFLIVDDICDGGRTFTEIAKILRERDAEKVELLVTHGIFSKGFQVFQGLIDHITTTDSFCDMISTDFVTVHSVGFGEDI